ncbi:hypothetical protein [Vibrio sp. TBV020]|uniref:hypothetical protein n=1 Tax=Vibrio sp. TBV020 TaxID=3137398 RepID=UPI0038CDC15E
MKFKKSLLSLSLALISATSYASSLEIKSIDGSEEFGKAGLPIIATEDGEFIRHYGEEGNINNYIWLDSLSKKTLGTGIKFIPSDELQGTSIELCKVTGVDMVCSNPLNIPRQFRMLRSAASVADFNNFWSVTNDITLAGAIYSDTTTISAETKVTYISSDTFSATNPTVAYVYAEMKDDAGTPLAYQAYMNAPSDDKGVTYSFPGTSLTLGSTDKVSYCSTIYTTYGETPQVDPACDDRVVSDKPTPPTEPDYYLPPTEDQFKALFPSQSYMTETVGAVTYAFAPRMSASGDNLLERYCDALSGSSTPMTASQLSTFGADSTLFTADYPGKTNYWTNDTGAGPATLPGGFGVTVAISGSGDTYNTSNQFYNGYYACKK